MPRAKPLQSIDVLREYDKMCMHFVLRASD